jgi:exosortase
MPKAPSLSFPIRPAFLVKWVILAAVLTLAYYPGFVWMWDRWSARDSYYGHGFLIPLVTLYWLFKERKSLMTLPVEFGTFGLFFLITGGVLHIVSSFLRIYFLSGFSFVLILLGVAGVLYGKKIFAKVWFPITFLTLAIPMPLLVISQTTLKMKFFVSEVAAKLLTLSHIPAHREGSYLFTPHSFILVGDPCSGLRSFLAFICLGFVFAYEGKMPLWKRLILIVSGLPLAIISNVARVYALGMIAEIYGMKSIEGAVHDASGVVVFVIAFGIFLLIKNILEAPHVQTR